MTKGTELLFTQYLDDLVFNTFGFQATIEVVFPKEGFVDITISGTPVQRAELMGSSGNHIKAIASLVRVFCRRQGFFVYLKLNNPYETDLPATKDSY